MGATHNNHMANSTPHAERHATRALLCGILLFGLLLRLQGWDYCITPDEAVAFDLFVRKGWRGIFLQPYFSTNHPVYSFLMWLAYLAFGERDWALQLPALVFGLAAIPTVYGTGRTLLNSRAVALVAAALLAWAPYHVAYSMSARGYTLVMLCALASALLLYLCLDRPTVPRLAALALCTFVMGLTHLSSLVLLSAWAAVLVAFTAGVCLAGRSRPIQALGRAAITAAALGIGLALVCIAYLPVFSLHRGLWRRIFHGAWPEDLLNFLSGAEQSVWHPFDRFAESITGLVGIAFWCAAALALFGLLTALARRRFGAGILLAALACPAAALLVVDLKPEPRYTLFLLPFFVIALAAGVVACIDALAWALARIPGFLVSSSSGLRTATACVFIGLYCAATAHFYVRDFPRGTTWLTCVFADCKSAARFLAVHMEDDDVVGFDQQLPAPVEHYLTRYVFPVLRPSPEPPESCRLWWIASPPDLAELPQISGAHAMRPAASYRGCALYQGWLALGTPQRTLAPPFSVDQAAPPLARLHPWTMDGDAGHVELTAAAGEQTPGHSALRVRFPEPDAFWATYSPPFSVSEGNLITVRAAVRGDVSLRNTGLALRFFDAHGSIVDSRRRAVPSASSNGMRPRWAVFQFRVLCPPGVQAASAGWYVNPPAPAGFHIDLRDMAIWVQAVQRITPQEGPEDRTP